MFFNALSSNVDTMNEVAELSGNERIAERELAGKDHSREISQYEEDAAGME